MRRIPRGIALGAITFTLLITGCVRSAAVASPVVHGGDVGQTGTQPTPHERDVQAAVLDSFFARGGARLVLVDSTVLGSSHFVDEDYASALMTLGALPDGLREDFEAKRARRRRVDSLATRVPVVFFTARDRNALRARNPDEYWRLFRERFPGSSARVAVSRVGFSREGRHALMLVDYGCGPLCGGTIYYLLVREGAIWRTIRTAQPRIS